MRQRYVALYTVAGMCLLRCKQKHHEWNCPRQQQLQHRSACDAVAGGGAVAGGVACRMCIPLMHDLIACSLARRCTTCAWAARCQAWRATVYVGQIAFALDMVIGRGHALQVLLHRWTLGWPGTAAVHSAIIYLTALYCQCAPGGFVGHTAFALKMDIGGGDSLLVLLRRWTLGWPGTAAVHSAIIYHTDLCCYCTPGGRHAASQRRQL